jgi:hypothetical protein
MQAGLDAMQKDEVQHALQIFTEEALINGTFGNFCMTLQPAYGLLTSGLGLAMTNLPAPQPGLLCRKY